MGKMADITEEKMSEQREILCFEVGEKIFGIESTAAEEISPTVETAKIPGAKPYIEGVFIKRERVITVIDMHRLLGIPCPKDKRGMFIICHVDSPDTRIGLHVSNVLSMRTVNSESADTVSTAYGDIPASLAVTDDVTATVVDICGVLNLTAE